MCLLVGVLPWVLEEVERGVPLVPLVLWPSAPCDSELQGLNTRVHSQVHVVALSAWSSFVHSSVHSSWAGGGGGG